MVTLEDQDIVPLAEFALAWRINDARWSRLPDEILDRLKPLSEAKGRELYRRSPLIAPINNLPNSGQQVITSEQSLEESGPSSVASEADCDRWFQRLPIHRSTEVYLCWAIGEGIALITDWGTFVEVWDDLWYPFDRMCVFDETAEWTLLFGPGEVARFAELPGEHASLADRAIQDDHSGRS